VTDGQNWIFLILKMNANGDGAIYAESDRTKLITEKPPKESYVTREMCDVIAGILSYWVSTFYSPLRHCPHWLLLLVWLRR